MVILISAEPLTENPRVGGSIPPLGTISLQDVDVSHTLEPDRASNHLATN